MKSLLFRLMDKIKKLPIIRHIRYYIAKARFEFWWFNYASKIFLIPNPADLDYLEAIRKGEV